MRSRLGSVLTALLLASSWVAVAAVDSPAVAAATNLRHALTPIVAAFTLQTGVEPRVSFSSSGNLFRQIQQGAPYQLFLSADEEYVIKLFHAGLTRDEGARYALGQLVLLVPNGSALEVDGSLSDLRAAIDDGRLRRFAIANPEHAPYGRAAREVLESRGLWNALQERLVIGENASQATQFAVSGSTDGGIVPLALAMAPAVATRSRFALLPEPWHSPLWHRAVLLRGAGPGAAAFYDFLLGPEATTIFSRYGFRSKSGGGW